MGATPVGSSPPPRTETAGSVPRSRPPAPRARSFSTIVSLSSRCPPSLPNCLISFCRKMKQWIINYFCCRRSSPSSTPPPASPHAAPKKPPPPSRPRPALAPPEECCICQDPLTTPVQLDSCSHILDENCLLEWTTLQPQNCPSCRASFTTMRPRPDLLGANRFVVQVSNVKGDKQTRLDIGGDTLISSIKFIAMRHLFPSEQTPMKEIDRKYVLENATVLNSNLSISDHGFKQGDPLILTLKIKLTPEGAIATVCDACFRNQLFSCLH